MTTIRSVTVQPNDGSSPTVTVVTPSEGDVAQVGDVLLIVHGNDFYPATNMPSPTVAPTATVVPVPGGSADAGDTGAHIKSYTATVASAGAQTVSVTETGDANEEKALTVFVLADADATSPIDDAAGTFGASATPQPAPAVVPGTADALLICHVNSGGGASTASYTTPGGMTEQYEIHVGGLSGVGASEQLVASGAIGTRTFTAATSVAWAAVSIAIRSAAGGGGTDADAAMAAAGVTSPDAAPEVAAQAQTAAVQVEAPFEPGTHVSVTLISDAPVEVEASAESASAVVGPVAGVAAVAATAVDAAASVTGGESALAASAVASAAGLDAGVVVAATAAVAVVAAVAPAAAGPGAQVSVGRMGARVRRGPEAAARSRRVAAMTGGGS